MIKMVTKNIVDEACFIYSRAWQATHYGEVRNEFITSNISQKQTEFLILNKLAKGNEIYLCYDQKIPIGIIILNIANSEIESLYVEPKFWNKGYGVQLLDLGIKKLHQSNQIFLTVMNVNERARKFYKKHGFVYSGEEKVLSAESGLSKLKYIYNEEDSNLK